jgi:hypothetical protein
MDDTDLVGYLTSKNLQLRKAGGGEIITNCLFCGESHRIGKLWLNTDTWLYQCWVCGEKGGRKSLLAHFGDEDSLEYADGADPNVRLRVLSEAAELAHTMLISNDGKLQYLLDRGLDPETIIEAKLGYVPMNVGFSQMLPGQFTRKALIAAGLMTIGGREFFNDSIVIPYFSHGQVVQLREKKQDGKYRTMGGDVARFYNVDSLRGASDVVITEGEFDALILAQTLNRSSDERVSSTAVVGLAGTNAWPDQLAGYFEDCRRVFVGFDPDDPGREAAAKLKRTIGNAAREIELPAGLPKCDWTEYLRERAPEHPHGGHTVDDVADLLLTADLAGKRMFSVSEAGARWARVKTETPGIKLGWPSLDAILRPGLKPGQVMIPLAKTGTGKTIFLSNIAHNLPDRRVLFVSMEMTAPEVFEHLRRIHFFWDQDTDVKAHLPLLRIADQNRLAPGDLAGLVDDYTQDVGAAPELLIVDYLQYFARGYRGASRYEKVSDATMELKAIAKEAGAAVICPSQVNRDAKDGQPLDSDDARDSGVIEETGDFVLSLFRPDAAINVQSGDNAPAMTGAFNVQLLKSRHGGKGRLFNLRFSNMSLVLVDVLADRKAAARVEIENTQVRRDVHYDDWRAAAAQPKQQALRLA